MIKPYQKYVLSTAEPMIHAVRYEDAKPQPWFICPSDSDEHKQLIAQYGGNTN